MNAMYSRCRGLLLAILIGPMIIACGGGDSDTPQTPPAADTRPRVIVTTDVGGTDVDDFQSLAHLLLYSDTVKIEGLISSPWGTQRNRVTELYKGIDAYASDYPNLKTYSDKYPTPEYLRTVTKQGGMDAAPDVGYSLPTDASRLIIEAAHRDDPRPLWILVWGGIDDLAQALHDDPSIKSKIRVYAIAGPNKKWATSAWSYITKNHPDLFMIENNATYRGWFTGGVQTGEVNGVPQDGATFVSKYLKDHGALGNLFYTKGTGTFKMGDTPSVAYVLGPNPENPAQESKGGGRFVRAWDRPMYLWDTSVKKPNATDNVVETYGMVELIVKPAGTTPLSTAANLVVPASTGSSTIDRFPGFKGDDGFWHFRFVTKGSGTWTYTIESTYPGLNDSVGGSFTSVVAARGQKVSTTFANWWTDDPDPAQSIMDPTWGALHGAVTISQWRSTFMADFAARTERLLGPKK